PPPKAIATAAITIAIAAKGPYRRAALCQPPEPRDGGGGAPAEPVDPVSSVVDIVALSLWWPACAGCSNTHWSGLRSPGSRPGSRWRGGARVRASPGSGPARPADEATDRPSPAA